jgi:hypothetical protein
MIALGVLACAFPSWAQEKAQASPSSGDSYSEHLKELSSGEESSKSASDAKSSESYKDHLRKLADGDTSVPAPAQSETSSENSAGTDGERSRKERTEKIAVSSDASTNQRPAKAIGNSDQMERVSVTRTKKDEPEPAAMTPQATPAANCSDAYCEQLRRVAEGQTQEPYVSRTDDGRTLTTERNFVKNLAFDQIHIWESPFKMRDSDATWAVPFGIVTGSLVATDRDVSKQLAKPSRLDTSKQISNLGLYSFIGAGAGFYGLGLISHDDHKRETGLLSGEAFINATLLAEALKYAFGRQRPFEADHFGHIGKGGSSFPSEHAIDSWAVATVFAHEYPNPFMQIAAYGLASAVSVSRITAGKHFPSDVLVGSTFGYLIGRKIYKDHHDAELGGSEYGTFIRERNRDAEHSGSAYVPLDSWVYPVIDRLAALGFIHSNFDSERPFTRLECARIAAEAAENTEAEDLPSDVTSMVDALQAEFSRESEVWAGNSDNRGAQLESVYTRTTEIAGPVLRDGFYFGQTLYNDYGRPFARGFNDITGFSARAESGPLVLYFQGEYQHSPGNVPYTPGQQSILSHAEGDFPVAVANPFPAVDQFRVLDAYVGVNFWDNELTLGQQSLWWGPGASGPFLFSDNAEPLKMVRLNNVSPKEIPWLSKLIGPMRYEMFLGQTDGYRFILSSTGLRGPNLATQPFVQGQRFSFKPTPNFEFGFSRTTVFGGTGFPLTSRYLGLATFSLGNTGPGASNKPGDRRSGLDLTYRIPWLHDWLSFYMEAFAEDEISPLFFPRRSSIHPGIYMPRLPSLRKMDLRVEGIYTDPPGFGTKEGPGYFYANSTFKDGYRQDGNLIGDWIGRDGRGIYATSTLWLSARNALQLGYREASVDRSFVEGGHYQDMSFKATYEIKRGIAASTMFQYEHWAFPVLGPSPQNNFVSSFQLQYSPAASH